MPSVERDAATSWQSDRQAVSRPCQEPPFPPRKTQACHYSQPGRRSLNWEHGPTGTASGRPRIHQTQIRHRPRNSSWPRSLMGQLGDSGHLTYPVLAPPRPPLSHSQTCCLLLADCCVFSHPDVLCGGHKARPPAGHFWCWHLGQNGRL